MEDSVELLELLVANKILDTNLKLRIVHQVLWKKYMEEIAKMPAHWWRWAGTCHQMIRAGSRLIMIFSSRDTTRSYGGGGGDTGGSTADDNAILTSFSPMVVTYRLTGLENKTTEDKVEKKHL